MWIRKARVVNGKVVVDAGEELHEGASVTVILQEAGESVRISTEDEQELLERMAKIRRGEGIPAQEVLAELPE